VLLAWRANASDDFDQSFLRSAPAMLGLLDSAQDDVSGMMWDTTPDVMLDMRSKALPGRSYEFDPTRLTGYAGNGEDTFSHLWGAVLDGKQAVGNGMNTIAALKVIEHGLETRSRTLLSDTARTAGLMSAKSVSSTAHYVRALTPPSCARCAILAGLPSGKIAFERHPRCDCTAIWSTSEKALATHYADAGDYLRSLSDDDLSHVLGSKANAQAYKDGADLNQLANAYRKRGDVRTAQLYGQRIKYTTEGTTKRGLAYTRMKEAGYVKAHMRYGSKYWRADRPRLMPETIYQIAGSDHAEALRLLRNYGWTD
jgi:hypothetical protein